MIALVLTVSCKTKRKSVERISEVTLTETRINENITERTFKRPSLDFTHSQVLTITDGIIKPVSRSYERDGVRIEFGVNESNELNAIVFIPSDTIRKTTTNRESDISQTTDRDSRTRSSLRTGAPGWALILLIIGASVIGYRIIVNRFKL